MTEHQSEGSNEVNRVPLNELLYPVLLLRRDSFFISSDADSIRYHALTCAPTLLIDSGGMSYEITGIREEGPVPLLKRQRGRLPVVDLSYGGQPVPLSFEQVRDKIIWLVSARGHFEIPQGLPTSVSDAESIRELLTVLVVNGWSHSSGGAPDEW